MTPVDLWAAVAAFTAGSAMAIRARMLRPRSVAWTAAPAVVHLSILLAALGLLIAAVTIFGGVHASQREAGVYTGLAVCSLVMLWNLNRNGRQAEVARQRFARDVAIAMEVSGPPAKYPGERP